MVVTACNTMLMLMLMVVVVVRHRMRARPRSPARSTGSTAALIKRLGEGLALSQLRQHVVTKRVTHAHRQRLSLVWRQKRRLRQGRLRPAPDV